MANGYNDEFFNGDDQSQSLENDAREIGDIAKDVKNIADKVKDHRSKDANEDTNGTNAGSKNVPSGANNVGGANQVQPNAAQAGGDAAANMSTSGAPGGDVAAGSGAASNAGASAGTGTTVGASGGAEAGAAAAGAGSATASGGAAAAEAGGAAAGSAASAGAAAGGAAAGGAAVAGGTGCAVVGGGCLVVVGGIILLFALLYIIILPVSTLIYGAEAVGDGITSWSQRVGQDLSIAKYDFMIDMYNISSALENFAFHILHPGQAAATDEILAELDEKELTLASDDFAPEYTDTTNSMVTTLDGAFRQGWAQTVQTAEYRAGLISATVAEGSGTVTDGYDSEELWSSSEFWADTSNWSSGDDYYQQGDWTPTPGETYQGQPTGEKVTISVRTIPDIDADGIPDNFVDEDANGNGVLDEGEDLNGNGVLDTNEDKNGNGILDAGEDINGNGLLDMADTEISEPCYMDAIIKLITLQNCAEQSILLNDDEDGNIKRYGVDATFSDDSIVGDENASAEEKMKSTEYQLLRLGGEIAGRGIQRQDLNSEQEFDSIYQIVTETKVTETPIVHDVEIRYEDTAGWISNPGQMEAGMKLFYQKTGVQPFIYITEEVDGSRDPSSAQMEEFSNILYDELFDDEAHLLVVLQDADGHYFTWFITGAQAKQVIDNEAVSILSDYIDRYYYDASLSSEEFISKSFESAADRIMSKTANPLVIIAVVSGIVIVIAIFAVVTVKKINERKRQDEQMERILNSDLNDMAKDPAIQNLENKYSDRS